MTELHGVTFKLHYFRKLCYVHIFKKSCLSWISVTLCQHIAVYHMTSHSLDITQSYIHQDPSSTALKSILEDIADD
jgi:hypothetical protein